MKSMLILYSQPFWANMVAAAGAGTPPIPHKLMTADKLSTAIKFCLQPSVVSAVQTMSGTMSAENGVQAAAQSFHANLPPPEDLACDIFDDRPAVWRYSNQQFTLKLSSSAAQALIHEGIIKPKDLKVYVSLLHGENQSTDIDRYQSRPITITNPRWDPVTGIYSSGFSTVKGMTTSALDMVASPYTAVKQANPDDSAFKTTGKAAAHFGKGFGKFCGRGFYGAVVGLPLATTEGLRAVPKLFGEEATPHREITDAASGFNAAGENFVRDMHDGLTGIYKKPMRRAKEEGALGFAKGAGQGLIGFTTKPISATIGLVAYSGHGISKSMAAPFRTSTRKAITAQRLSEGSIMAQRLVEGEHLGEMEKTNREVVLRRFQEFAAMR